MELGNIWNPLPGTLTKKINIGGDTVFKILLATDGSDSSFRAVDKTIQMVKGMKAEVTALSVVQEIPFYQLHEGLAPEHLEIVQKNFQEKAEGAAKRILEKVENMFRVNGLEVKTIFKMGHPAETIRQVAEEGGFDFVVMGNRGLGGIKELVLGSVSNRVAHSTKSSVIIIK